MPPLTAIARRPKNIHELPKLSDAGHWAYVRCLGALDEVGRTERAAILATLADHHFQWERATHAMIELANRLPRRSRIDPV